MAWIFTAHICCLARMCEPGGASCSTSAYGGSGARSAATAFHATATKPMSSAPHVTPSRMNVDSVIKSPTTPTQPTSIVLSAPHSADSTCRSPGAKKPQHACSSCVTASARRTVARSSRYMLSHSASHIPSPRLSLPDTMAASRPLAPPNANTPHRPTTIARRGRYASDSARPATASAVSTTDDDSRKTPVALPYAVNVKLTRPERSENTALAASAMLGAMPTMSSDERGGLRTPRAHPSAPLRMTGSRITASSGVGDSFDAAGLAMARLATRSPLVRTGA
mmetsp:Transcript_3143/g.11269  ORF Transcript_3143/g.11269 Transcript_3143/m.11269 type:complete len:281 (+) Transcript_3143:586-1428(+)